MLCTIKWVKKSLLVDFSTWPLNSHNCSENNTKTRHSLSSDFHALVKICNHFSVIALEGYNLQPFLN